MMFFPSKTVLNAYNGAKYVTTAYEQLLKLLSLKDI